MDELTIYEFWADELCEERHVHAVCARSVEEAVKMFMARYTGVYSDEYTQYQILNHALICIETANDQHSRVEWGIEEHDIRPGMLF